MPAKRIRTEGREGKAKVIAEAQRRRKIEKWEKEDEDRRRDEKEEEEEEEKAKGDLTSGVLLVNSMIAIVFSSLPWGEGDMNGGLAILGFNLVWTFVFFHNTWLDYAALIAANLMLGIYVQDIMQNFHKVPALLPPEQWAIFLGGNGILALIFWWFVIRKEEPEDREAWWNILVLGLTAVNIVIGLGLGLITWGHLIVVFGRLRGLLLTGDITG
eukprot:TRINITY_DN34122_c0_g1_i1.p1 TRINITY_DN34122_c0_g1~~TRINITY_DN34122_c0_g1_i1.p1  ORF type:complete len:214 (+),score=26.05 TRINITY_DN34122_c0_g1_i1:139-780(+)